MHGTLYHSCVICDTKTPSNLTNGHLQAVCDHCCETRNYQKYELGGAIRSVLPDKCKIQTKINGNFTVLQCDTIFFWFIPHTFLESGLSESLHVESHIAAAIHHATYLISISGDAAVFLLLKHILWMDSHPGTTACGEAMIETSRDNSCQQHCGK